MSLSDWLSNDWVVQHRSSAQEIAQLLSVADRALGDAQVPGLSPDGQPICPFDAALACGNQHGKWTHPSAESGPTWNCRSQLAAPGLIARRPERLRRP